MESAKRLQAETQVVDMTTELSQLKAQLEQQGKDLEDVADQRDKLQQEVNSLRVGLDAEKKINQELSKKREKKEKKLVAAQQKLQKDVSSHLSQSEQLQQKLDKLKDQLTEEQRLRATFEAEKINIEREFDEFKYNMETERNLLKGQIESLSKKIEIEAKAQRDRIAKLDKNKAELKSQLDQAKGESEGLKKKAFQEIERAGNLDKAKKDLEDQVTQLTASISDRDSQLAALKKGGNADKEVTRLNTELLNAKDELNKLQTKHSRLLQKLHSV